MLKRSLLIVATVAFAGLGLVSTATAADPLRVGIEGAYPPFSVKNADGSLTGFDIDIANAVCEKLGRECELVEQDWDGMIPALKARKFDAIIASMSITEERKRQIDFSAKYYSTPAKLVAAKGADFEGTPDGLSGKRLGVQRGTTHQCYAEKAFPDAELVLYGTQEDVFRDLELGRIDAQLSDSLVAQEGFLSTDAGSGYDFIGGDLNDLECFGEGAGIAVRKGEEELRDALSAAIVAIREDGTYEAINAQYFPFDIYGE